MAVVRGVAVLMVVATPATFLLWWYREFLWRRRRRVRYCHVHSCIRLAVHPGLHVDASGRTWL